MPRYQIFEQCMVDIIYEVNADSKEEAYKIWKDNHQEVGFDEGDDSFKCIGECDYESTGKINIEKI